MKNQINKWFVISCFILGLFTQSFSQVEHLQQARQHFLDSKNFLKQCKLEDAQKSIDKYEDIRRLNPRLPSYTEDKEWQNLKSKCPTVSAARKNSQGGGVSGTNKALDSLMVEAFDWQLENLSLKIEGDLIRLQRDEITNQISTLQLEKEKLLANSEEFKKVHAEEKILRDTLQMLNKEINSKENGYKKSINLKYKAIDKLIDFTKNLDLQRQVKP